jgi:hypothetical protein
MLAPSRVAFLALVLGASSPLTIGCMVDTGSEPVSSDEAALEQANGGMTTAAEDPGFGEETILNAETLDTTFADSKDLTTDAAALPGAKSYRLVLLWGHLPPAHDTEDANVTPKPIDWSGNVSVDAGAIGVERTLRFDPKDSVSPRTSPQEVSFVSHTLPAVDGLLLHVVIPSGGSTLVHFDTAALSTDIDLTEVAQKGGGAVQLGDGRNGLGFAGYADVAGCNKGFVFGRWIKAHAGFGHLRGRVVDGNGEALGHVRGIWGHAPKKDKNVFFGKYIDSNGEFRGLFGGEYGGGAFAGLWKTANPKDGGVIEGRYFDGPDANDGKGFYVSRWSEACAAK